MTEKKAAPEENEKKPLIRHIGERLRAARLLAGYRTAKEFSDKHGYAQPTYIQHENGNRSQIDYLARYARDLGRQVDWFLRQDDEVAADPPSAIETIRLIGEVQAGIWREAEEYPEAREVPFVPTSRGATRPEFALEVKGASMNLVYPEGTILYCVTPYHNGSPCPLSNGRRVIVQRSRSGGLLVEATVKEVWIENGKTWLRPRSSDPRFQTPLEMDGADVEEVKIVGVVIGSYTPEL